MCRRQTPVRNKDAIVLSLRRLSTMTQSSEELDDTLDDLVSLVHCNLHIRGSPSESRVHVWIQTFPKMANSESSPVVLAREIRKVLGPISPICMGIAKTGARCKARIGGHRVQNCGRSIAELVRVDDYWDRAVCELFLSVLEANRYCHFHVSQQSMENVQTYLTDLSRIHKAAQLSITALSAGTSSVFAYSKHAALAQARTTSCLQGKIDAMLKSRRPFSTTNKPDPLSWPSDGLLNFWPSKPDTTPLDIISSVDSVMDKEHLHADIRDTITAPLDPDDQKEGYVYAYEVEGSPGKVKIGYTTRSIEVRQKEWNYDCNRTAKLLYPTEPDQFESVSNARRVEALCHAELGEHRLRVYCHGCIKQHTEWFEISTEKALRAIRKWTLWMKTKPYRKGFEGQIVLSSKWQQAVVDEQMFLTQLSNVE